jgi:hypothetical protein
LSATNERAANASGKSEPLKWRWISTISAKGRVAGA